jgi:hypothetical protein
MYKKKIFYFKFNDLNRKKHDINLKLNANTYQSICPNGLSIWLSLSILSNSFFRILIGELIYEMEKE